MVGSLSMDCIADAFGIIPPGNAGGGGFEFWPIPTLPLPTTLLLCCAPPNSTPDIARPISSLAVTSLGHASALGVRTKNSVLPSTLSSLISTTKPAAKRRSGPPGSEPNRRKNAGFDFLMDRYFASVGCDSRKWREENNT